MSSENRFLRLIYGADALKKVSESNVLVVGAGGIGCELIKNLSQSGFRKFSIIDLDTIELTNLNRQFYFRKKHINQSKALVAKESILKIVPGLEITAYHDDLFSSKFDL